VIVICDDETHLERAVFEGEAFYISRESGRFVLAPPGEKTALWARPQRVGDTVSLEIYTHLKGEDRFVDATLLPFCRWRPWPKEGVTYKGLQIGSDLIEQLKMKWYGPDLLTRDTRVRIEVGGVCFYLKPSEWMAIESNQLSFPNSKQRLFAPLIRLAKVEDDQLSFEVVDAKGQDLLEFQLNRSNERLEKGILDSLHFIGRRQLETLLFESTSGEPFTAPLGSYLSYEKGQWVCAENSSVIAPLLYLERINYKADGMELIATLYSSHRSRAESTILKGIQE